MKKISISKLHSPSWKAAATIALTALLVLAPTSCKKKDTAPQAQGSGPVPTIDTAGSDSFGDASGSEAWIAQRAANDKKVSVGAGKSFAHITYKPNVKVIDKAAVDASLQGISSDGHGAVFKNASAEIRALKAGDIFLVKNGFAAKVLGAETDGDQTVVIVDAAMLTDVVANGEINLDSPIGFHGSSNSAALRSPARRFHWMDMIETPVEAQASTIKADPTHNLGKTVKDALISGWKIDSYSITPGDNQANFNARLMKDASGFKSAIAMDGNVTNFQFASNLKFSPNTASQVVTGLQGMSGKMHFVWEIGKDTPGVWAQEDKLKLPVGMEIPLGPVLEGLPLALEMSAAFLIHPALTGGNEYSKGGFTIQWVGSTSNAAQSAAPGDEGLTFTITDEMNVSPAAPTGMVISICAPRVELKLTVLGAYGDDDATLLRVAASVIDSIVDGIEKHLLSPAAYAAFKASPLSNVTASNILASQADVYVQVIHTEGVTHSANITFAPCTKTELKITAQSGGDANLLGLTDKAMTVKDIYTKTFTKWDPGSSFCKSI
jgi:hypothetical protein